MPGELAVDFQRRREPAGRIGLRVEADNLGAQRASSESIDREFVGVADVISNEAMAPDATWNCRSWTVLPRRLKIRTVNSQGTAGSGIVPVALDPRPYTLIRAA